MNKEGFTAEPYRIKSVEPIRLIPKEEREKKIKEAHYNIFNLRAEDIYIDLLTDSGTSAMSNLQWSAIMMGDESYAGARSYFNFTKAVQDIMGFEYVIPTHQGRPAESFLFKTLIKKGDVIPFNMPFDSTAAHVLDKGGTFVECVKEIAYQPLEEAPFKGDIDLEKLEKVIKKEGKERIPFVMITITNNTGGGQPVSMKNIREVRQLTQKYGISLYIDAARCAENAYFIQQREPGYKEKTIAEIVKEQFSYVDGCTMSAKKDPLVNMGGFIGLHQKDLYLKILPHIVLNEGFVTYGGMSGRDLEALAQGLREMVDDDYIANRVRQVQYLGDRLYEIGIPMVRPIGGHAVFVDAKGFLPHIPLDQYPSESLAVALYIEAGIRGIGLGRLAFGEESKMELFRLAIPRRVYTDRHMDVVVEGFKRLMKRRNEIRGVKIVYEPDILKHFLCQLELE